MERVNKKKNLSKILFFFNFFILYCEEHKRIKNILKKKKRLRFN
jgi:hypothetical protein